MTWLFILFAGAGLAAIAGIAWLAGKSHAQMDAAIDKAAEASNEAKNIADQTKKVKDAVWRADNDPAYARQLDELYQRD